MPLLSPATCRPQIFQRGTERILDVAWDAMKKEVTLAVENDVSQHLKLWVFRCPRDTGAMTSLPPQLQSSVTEYEFSQEEYHLLQDASWSKFYACCLQYQEALSTPLGLHVNPASSMVCLLKKVRVPASRTHASTRTPRSWVFTTTDSVFRTPSLGFHILPAALLHRGPPVPVLR